MQKEGTTYTIKQRHAQEASKVDAHVRAAVYED